MTAADAIETAARADFEGIDLLVRDIVDSGANVPSLRRRMDALGLRGGGWTLPMNWKNEAEAFEVDLAKLPRYAAAAAELGLLRTGTWVRYESDPIGDDALADPDRCRAEVTRSLAWQTERLARIAEVLNREGSRLGLEILGSRSERTGKGVVLTSSYEELLRTFNALRQALPNVGVLADAYHLYASGEPATAALGWGCDSLVWVHLADPANPDRSTMRDVERRLPGESVEGLSRQLLTLMAECGYDGPVTAEPLMQSRSFNSSEPLARAQATRESLRRVWP